MSMLSAQIDELRATAEEIDWEFPFTASRLRDAADTIWQLREDLQKANAENAKLRKLVARMASALGIDSEWCDTSWCDVDCMIEFGCKTALCGGENRCPAWTIMRELGVEVPE